MPASAASGADSAAHMRSFMPARRTPSATAIVPGDRPHTAVERELADARVLEQAMRRELVRAGEDGERDRKVEARALFAKRGRSEVDRDPVRPGPGQHRVDDPGLHPVLRLLAGAVGEPDDRERGQIGRDEVRLDLDAPGLEPDDGRGEGAGDHAVRRYAGTRAVSVPEVHRNCVNCSRLSARRRRGSTRSTRRHAGRCAG